MKRSVDKKTMVIMAIVVGAVIAAAILYAIFAPNSATPTISMPQPSNGSGSGGDGLLDVTPDTVQTVLANLSRSEAYSREYKVTSYWTGGSSVQAVKVWHYGSKTRISAPFGATNKNTLFADGKIYIWYDDSSRVFTTGADDVDISGLDRYARLVDSRDIESVSADQITAAGYENMLGENCVYAEYKTGDNYVNRIYVSVSSGLLVSAQVEEGTELIYEMQSSSTELTAPDESVFTPPST